jgi:hypothetical protein
MLDLLNRAEEKETCSSRSTVYQLHIFSPHPRKKNRKLKIVCAKQFIEREKFDHSETIKSQQLPIYLRYVFSISFILFSYTIFDIYKNLFSGGTWQQQQHADILHISFTNKSNMIYLSDGD